MLRLGCYLYVGRAGGSERDGLRAGCLDPSPYPLPWAWTAGFATRWSVQDGLRWLQEGLSEPKMTSKMAQDSPTWLMIAHSMPPRGSKTASRRLQEAKEPPKEAPERPKSFKHLKKINVFGLLAFSLMIGF